MERSTTLRKLATGRTKRIRDKKAFSAKQNTTELVTIDLEYLRQLSISTQYLVRMLDKLKGKKVYSYRLKTYANIFLSEIEKYTSEYVWAKADFDINEASQQMEDLVDMMQHFMFLSMSLNHLGKGQLQLFFEHMQTGFNRFNIPLRFVDGELVKI